MARVKLDRIDLKILRDLQHDGRITNVDLAKTLGFRHRRACVASEISKLLVVFEATTPISTRSLLGFGVTVFANVGLHSQAETDLVAFEERVAQWPGSAGMPYACGRDGFLT